MYKYTDYLNEYGRIMQFNKNKSEPYHRWYSFVEGYSKEFIQSIMKEIPQKDNIVCLEPFSGSGTTALELQNMGIKCSSFEVNPLMFLIAKVKLENNYDINDLEKWFNFICKNREKYTINSLNSEFSTLYEGEGKVKWNYDISVAIAVEKLKFAVNEITDSKYKDLFTVALAAILLDVSNLYRNGKCLSYKKNWKNKKVLGKDVFQIFDKKVTDELIHDLTNVKRNNVVNNKETLYNEDSRISIYEKIEDATIDLVITSPPYLNSRDYTDTYMLELKTLGFTANNSDIRVLREKTLRSHVQIKWNDKTNINNHLLNETLSKLQEGSVIKKIWNKSIIDMVRLYFVDVRIIFNALYKKLKNGGRVYFNVSNSAYFNVLINALEICASIAENEGFKVIEIRKARYLKTSPQQKKNIEKLLEGVIVLER